MNKTNTLIAAILTGVIVWIGPAIVRADEPATKPAAEDPAYTSKIEARTNEIVALLGIDDPKKTSAVHDIIITQYRTLNTWHDAHDAELKSLAKQASSKDAAVADKAKAQTDTIKASLKVVHDEYLAKLATELTPEQIEKVKDKMTYGKVEFTYRGYLQSVPDMTDEQKAHVLEMLKEAREIAMDGGSAEEKTAIFTKYKGKINNYLASQGKGGKPKKSTTQPAK